MYLAGWFRMNQRFYNHVLFVFFDYIYIYIYIVAHSESIVIGKNIVCVLAFEHREAVLDVWRERVLLLLFAVAVVIFVVYVVYVVVVVRPEGGVRSRKRNLRSAIMT